MRILGVDPGIQSTGYGAIQTEGKSFRLIEAGVVSTPRNKPLAERLERLRRGLRQVLENCQPEIVIVEELYSHAQHPRTAILMGHARGVLLSACSEKKLPVVDFPAKRVKKAITGNGNATKGQMQEMVKMLLRLKETSCPTDVFDALALAMSYVYLGNRLP
ncbi:MAG: crossover junction endodeoxyribonuclease RuvC [Candidatus Omnitrophica bacterium]|nr:crossover junction endodeoxyribonuclease RuvC [Candidatus Omnitrophota bacterium]